MITINNKEGLQTLVGWFRTHLFFPKAMITRLEVDPQEPAASVVHVNFGGFFEVTFFGGVVEVEDVCRCHNDECAMQTVRAKIAAFLQTTDTFNIGGTTWDELLWEQKVNTTAFAQVFG